MDVFGKAVRVVILFLPSPAFRLDLVVQDHCWRNDHDHKEEVDNNHDTREESDTSYRHDRIPGVAEDDNRCCSIGPKEATETPPQHESHSPLQLSLEDVRAELSRLKPSIEHDVDVVGANSDANEDRDEVHSAHVFDHEDALIDDHSGGESYNEDAQTDEADDEGVGVQDEPEEGEDEAGEDPWGVVEHGLLEGEVVEHLCVD